MNDIIFFSGSSHQHRPAPCQLERCPAPIDWCCPLMYRPSWILFSIVSPTVSLLLRPSFTSFCQSARRSIHIAPRYNKKQGSAFFRRITTDRNFLDGQRNSNTPGLGTGRQQMTEDASSSVQQPAKPAGRTRSSTTRESATVKQQATAPTEKKGSAKKRKGPTKLGEGQEVEVTDVEKASTAKKKKAPAHQVQTDRDEIPKLWDTDKAAASGSYTFKIASWNVAGIRALLKNNPSVLRDLVDRHDLDVLCLQETKLQENHLDDPKLNLRATTQLLDDYDDYWSCSTAKKGYSGTAVFVRKRSSAGRNDKKVVKQTTLTSFVGKADTAGDKKPNADLPIDDDLLVPASVSFGIGKSEHDAEGRTITVDFPQFSLCNVYVPNSGQKLERLSYRTDHWDKDFLVYMQSLATTQNKPVLWVGDLNVAHTRYEVWNDGAKHLAKQAGVTAEERASFQSQLDSGYVDAFRRLHPTAAGHYSYWSTRAGNRPVNKGLRLDYFICHPDFFKADGPVLVRDCYMDFDRLGSDHCPVILEISMQ